MAAEPLLDRFMPRGDVSETHSTVVRAPAGLVFEVARGFDLATIPVVRLIFWLRSRILGSAAGAPSLERGLLAETTAMGWRILAERPGREVVVGAATQPWLADVVFRPIPPEEFQAFAESDLVKIAWTIEAEPLETSVTRLTSRTRVVATDEPARRKFRSYWRKFGGGIILIRWLLLPAIRREAERQYRRACREPS